MGGRRRGVCQKQQSKREGCWYRNTKGRCQKQQSKREGCWSRNTKGRCQKQQSNRGGHRYGNTKGREGFRGSLIRKYEKGVRNCSLTEGVIVLETQREGIKNRGGQGVIHSGNMKGRCQKQRSLNKRVSWSLIRRYERKVSETVVFHLGLHCNAQ